jgi:nucleoside-diphosphate-sugar epimerase
VSVHARTRLEEERLLFARTENAGVEPVVLRLGMVYGRGVLMIEAARWLARHRLHAPGLSRQGLPPVGAARALSPAGLDDLLCRFPLRGVRPLDR